VLGTQTVRYKETQEFPQKKRITLKSFGHVLKNSPTALPIDDSIIPPT